jgi:hypothetical protein
VLLSISYQLREDLQARGVPFDVVYGPERLGQTPLAASHIVLERDRATGDELLPVTAHRRNPRVDHVRGIGATLRVFARSTAAGAGPGDHERVADRVVDQCLISLRAIVAARRTQWRLRSAKLLSADEAGERGLETWPGVIYEARFVIDRGVADAGWTEAETAAAAAGTATADEATFGGAHGVSVATTLDTSDGPAGSDELPSATTRN